MWGFPPTSAAEHILTSLRQFGYSFRLGQALLDFNPDIVQTHGIWMYPSVATLNWHRKTRRPYIVSPHGMLDSWALRSSSWKKILARRLYEDSHLRSAACIRALCLAEAQAIRDCGLKNPVCVIPNGIRLPQGSPDSTPPWDARIGSGRNVLLYLGRIHPKKGLSNLVQAWINLQSRNTGQSRNWDLVLAGWDQGGHEQTLKDLARREGSNCHIHFIGPQFDKAKSAAYHAADAFILPSFSEGLPMVVLEAWSHGKPVLMTPQCNLPEGFESDAATPIEATISSIEQGLESLFSMTAEERRAMGERGLQLVTQRFTWSSIATEMLAVFEWTLGAGAKPQSVIC